LKQNWRKLKTKFKLIGILKKYRKRLAWVFSTLAILTGLFTFLADSTIRNFSSPYIYADIESLPERNVGLLLGTSSKLKKGGLNPFFYHRISTAVQLFQSGKIKHIIVSGDNGTMSYNEPVQMKKYLVLAGIPPEKITLDYAGFRTLDSVVRAKLVFGQRNILIISQKFHNERAVYLARKSGLDAIAFNAPDVSFKNSFKTRIRELFARDKAVIDILMGVKPKFEGPQIEIIIDNPEVSK
jgi:SanA protein